MTVPVLKKIKNAGGEGPGSACPGAEADPLELISGLPGQVPNQHRKRPY